MILFYYFQLAIKTLTVQLYEINEDIVFGLLKNKMR